MDTEVVSAVSETAVDRAYKYVKAEIMSRRTVAHDVLSEGQVAAAVGVSRTPVREALLLLQAEGMLRLLPKRGALVLPVTTEQMKDLIETRRLVESFAVRKVIAGSHVATLGLALHAHLQIMRDAMARGDGLAYVGADRAFHAEIVAASGNSILTEVYAALRDRQLRMGAVNLLDEHPSATDTARMRATLVEHERIAAAIASRRVREAEAAVQEHLDRAEQLLATRR
jgi:DNA-binding GntR family transcriptional regulator